MKKQTLITAALAALSFGSITVAAAQGPEGGPMRRPGGPGGQAFGPGHPGGAPAGRVAEHLGLSDEQKAQWKAIHEKARETGEPLMKAAGEARQAFDKALQAENADAATVGRAALAMKAAQKNVEAHHKATFAEVKTILTPEQLAKFEEGEKRERWPGPGGFGHGGRVGPGMSEGRGRGQRRGPRPGGSE